MQLGTSRRVVAKKKIENQGSSTTKARTTTGAKQDRQRFGVANERQHVIDFCYNVISKVFPHCDPQ